MSVYYKFLNGREATHVPGFRYRLKQWQPPVKGPLVPCENGYHVLRPEQVAGDFIARDLFVAEVRGEVQYAGSKVVARECRIVEHLPAWNERTQRLFAADCAERALPLFERYATNGDGPRLAIQAARDYANGLIDATAMDAASCAAGDAAIAAAGDAAIAAAGAAAIAAAGAAAWAAAWNAAWNAARAAASAAERKWQSARLLDYAHEQIT